MREWSAVFIKACLQMYCNSGKSVWWENLCVLTGGGVVGEKEGKREGWGKEEESQLHTLISTNLYGPTTLVS